jgi:CelD/BcsL family acetyltransferase involved in cellulose biosynthesis
MSKPVKWQVQAHIGPVGMRVLEADWRRLALASNAGPHLNYETHLAYFACHSLAEGRYTCLALSDGQRVRAICPLEHQTFPMLGRHIAAIGLPWFMMDLQRDLLCEDDEARAALMSPLLRWLQSQPGMPRWLVMDWVPADSQALRAVRALPAWRAAHSAREPTAVFDCRSEAPAWEQRLSQKFRWSLRHGARRLQAQGEPRYTRHVHPDALQPAFDTFLALEASGWKSRADKGLTVRDRPAHKAFYQALVSSAPSGSGLEIHLLHLGEVCIAGVICLRSGREVAIPKISYDERYAACSPGQLMLQWTLALCRADTAIDRVNMVSNAAWLRSWRPDILPNHRVLIGLRPLSGPLWTIGLRLLLAAWPKLKRWLRAPQRPAS